LRELAAVRVRFGYRRLTFLLKREGWNGKLRDECVNSRVLTSVVEAKVRLGAWRQDYNRVRPAAACRIERRLRWMHCGSTHVRHVSRLPLGTIGSKPRSQRGPANGRRLTLRVNRKTEALTSGLERDV